MSIIHNRPWTTVILFQGSDLDPLAERRAAFQRATLEQLASGGKSPLRIGDDGEDDEGEEAESEPKQKAREHDEFLDAAIERATHVRLAAVARKVYGALLAEHPPRDDERAPDTTDAEGIVTPGEVIDSHEQDAQFGFDVDGIAEPLVLGCLEAWDDDDVRPDDEPAQFESDEDRQAFLDGLSEPEFSRLFSAAVQLNRGGGPDPKVRLSSLLDRMSSAT